LTTYRNIAQEEMGRDRTDCPVRCPLEYFGAAPGFLRLVSYS
jgi:hypothetical protein